MAKSLRSKHGRAMRAAKRAKNEPRVDARLVRLAVLDNASLAAQTNRVVVKPVVERMETEENKVSSKTLRDSSGKMPVWVNQRKMKRIKGKQTTAVQKRTVNAKKAKKRLHPGKW